MEGYGYGYNTVSTYSRNAHGSGNLSPRTRPQGHGRSRRAALSRHRWLGAGIHVPADVGVPIRTTSTWWSPDPNAVCARGLMVHSGPHSGGHGARNPEIVTELPRPPTSRRAR